MARSRTSGRAIARAMALVIACIASVIAGAFAGAREDGLAFLEANKLKPDVVTLPSGLQYRVLKSGPEGGKSPTKSTPCACHYSGRTIEGAEFDSSYKRGKPTTFAPNQVIKGWTEAMQLMKEGDKWELVIPSELAYGKASPTPLIKPDSVLVFDMELVKVGA